MKKRSDGLYQISVVVEEHGRRKRKYFYGKTHQEAKRKMMAWREDNSRGRSFADVANEWAERHREEVAAGTWTCYRPAVDRALDAFGDIPIRLITPTGIQGGYPGSRHKRRPDNSNPDPEGPTDHAPGMPVR